MQRRNIALAGAALIVLLAVGGIVYATNRDTTTPHFWAKAKATPASVACLAANSKLNVPKNVRSDIEMRALGYLADVPAGTNVDVRIATYSQNTVTGSDHYPARYGTYNFAMTKESDGWHFTDFKHCY